jgi:phosphate transport system substrate-binding protein
MRDIGRRALLSAGAAVLTSACAGPAVKLYGSGATLPAHQYAAWWAAYAVEVPQVEIAYLPIGSGGGIRQLAERTVDFGATDVELDDVERELLGREVVSIPTAIIAVAVCYNLAGVLGLRLSRGLCAAIYLGEVTRWDDLAIRAENPRLTLPSLAIAPVFRADGGGSTALFTSRVAAVTPALRDRVGVGRGARFSVGVGARGSDGVVDLVSSIPGGLGYVEVVHALRAGLPVAALDDGHGGYVAPTRSAVLQGCEADDATRRGYPLASPTYLVAGREWASPAKGAAMAQFSYWALTKGQRSLDYGAADDLASTLLPLPPAISARARAEVARFTSGSTRLLAID